MHVATRKGQTLFVAHDGTAHDRHTEREVFIEATHHGQLLKVLLSEVGPGGAGDGKKFGNDTGHAVEVSGSTRTLKEFGHSSDRHGGRRGGGSSRPHLVHTGGHDGRRTPGLAVREISRFIAGISGEILRVVELTGIDKNSDDGNRAIGHCATDQRAVALVKCAHSRHEPHRLAATTELRGVGPPLLNRVDLNHCYDRVRARWASPNASASLANAT